VTNIEKTFYRSEFRSGYGIARDMNINAVTHAVLPGK
jgi:hypothetical protein